MATLLQAVRPARKQYLDRTQFDSLEDQNRAKGSSRTLYVGGLSALTVEEQVHALFAKCGAVQRVIMGLHRIDRTPCGFCFVEYATRRAAVAAESVLDAAQLDGVPIKVEMDPGFREGRQYGRARSGGQVSVERRHHPRGGPTMMQPPPGFGNAGPGHWSGGPPGPRGGPGGPPWQRPGDAPPWRAKRKRGGRRNRRRDFPGDASPGRGGGGSVGGGRDGSRDGGRGGRRSDDDDEEEMRRKRRRERRRERRGDSSDSDF